MIEVQYFIQFINIGIVYQNINCIEMFIVSSDNFLWCVFCGDIYLYEVYFNILFFNYFFCFVVIFDEIRNKDICVSFG